MPDHQKREIRESLGVDMCSMEDPVYSQELIRDRLIQFRRKREHLYSMWDKVERDAHFDLVTTGQAG